MGTKVHPRQVRGVSNLTIEVDVDNIMDEISAARGTSSTLAERILDVEISDFAITNVVYDEANTRLVITVAGGIASIDNVTITKSSTSLYIDTPTINTTYYVFVNKDTSITYSTSGTESNSALLVASIATGSELTTTTTADKRCFLQRGGPSGDAPAYKIHSETRGNNFAGPTGVVISHSIGNTNYEVIVTPTQNPNGYLGEVWVEKANNSYKVCCSGTTTTSFDTAVIKTTA